MNSCLSTLPFSGSGALLGVLALFALWVLWKVQRSPKPVDFVDLILDDAGKASWSRIMAIGGFLFSSWVMAHLELTGKMTYEFFGLYFGVCVGGAVYYQTRKGQAGDGAQNVNVSAPAGASVNVRTGAQPGDPA